jgi:hypothetical protein
MTAENLKIIKQLIRKFGEVATVDKIQEESQELGLALHQLKCPTKIDKKKLLNDVYSELADMKIAMRSAEMLFNKRKINRIVNKKLQKKKEKYLTPLKPAPKTIKS